MRLEQEEKHRLRDLFTTQLRTCEQVPVSFGPAKHRSTQIDNEKVLQGTSDTPAALSSLPAHRKPASAKLTVAAARSSNSASKPRRKVQTARPKPATEEDLEPATWTVYQSDFAATAAAASTSTNILIHSPARLAAARRKLESSNEWAEINKLQALQTQQEAAAKQRQLLLQQAQQRRQLDQQVAEHSKVQQAALAAKAAELAAAVADVEAHQQEQAAKEAAAKRAAEKVKQECERQVVAAEAAKARAAAKKAREEAALLAAAQRQMAAAQAAAAAKAAAARKAAEEAKLSNISAQEAKKQAAWEQQCRDEELMRETIRTLERQEAAREAALRAFHDNIASRAAVAGAIAVASSKARQEREERLMAASEARAKAEAEAKHAAEVAKRAAQVLDRKAAAAAAAAAKAAAQQAALEEQARLRAQVQAELAEYQRSEELTAQQRRQRNLAHRLFLEKQIVEAEERVLLDDVFMAPKERELNRRLLAAARSTLDSVSHA